MDKWSPVQILILTNYLINQKKYYFKKVFFILTPQEINSFWERNPSKDARRNYPYKDGDSIHFFTSEKTSFPNQISLSNKIKRFCKSLLTFKIYNSIKYYGVSRRAGSIVTYDDKKLDWFTQKINQSNFKSPITLIIINNLNGVKIENINQYKLDKNFKDITLEVIDFPDDINNYFTSNSHLNEKGNNTLVKLISPLIY